MKIEKEVLVMCCVCQKIRTDDTSDFWLSREENSEGYDSLMRDYKDRISHAYCPQHYQEATNEGEKYKEIKLS